MFFTGVALLAPIGANRTDGVEATTEYPARQSSNQKAAEEIFECTRRRLRRSPNVYSYGKARMLQLRRSEM